MTLGNGEVSQVAYKTQGIPKLSTPTPDAPCMAGVFT